MMTYLDRIKFAFLYIFIFTPIIIGIFTFFGVPPETYLNYVFWMVALGIFFTIIPNSGRNIFKMY